MLIRFLLIVFCLSMMIASAKAGINEGIEFYQMRQEGSKGTLASLESGPVLKINHISCTSYTQTWAKHKELYCVAI